MSQEIESGLTLYDVNKQFLQEAKPLSAFKLREEIEKIVIFLATKHEEEGNRYFMLLNKERSDYTIFHLNRKWNPDAAHEILKECFSNRGEVMSINKAEDDVAFEIWLRIDGEIFVYYIFTYDTGVVEL